MLPQGRGPQGTGHKWQAFSLALVWQSTCPQVFGLGPNRLKDSIPPNPSLSGGGQDENVKAADGDPTFALPGLQGAQGCMQLPFGL